MLQSHIQEMHQLENEKLRMFVLALGFSPENVIEEFSEMNICKEIALKALKVRRDFTTTAFTESGIIESNKWLDKLIKT